MRACILFIIMVWPLLCSAWNDPPVVSNIRYDNDLSAQEIRITFDVSDPEKNEVEILFRASFDEGNKFLVNTEDATGDIGMNIPVGNDLEIIWDYSNYWDDIEGKTIRIVADDGFRPDIQEILDAVDSIRMRDLLEYMSQPRTINTHREHLFAVRDTLAALMTLNDYEVRLQEYTFMNQTATNVIGRKPGLGNEGRTIVMDAHYDAHENAPGADDNGSGVVGFMEAMFLLADYQFDKSIEFVGFDQEETGLIGSINYSWLGGIESWNKVDAVLNYEMIGYYSERPNSQEVPLGLDILLADQYQELVEDQLRGNFIFIAANEESAFIPELYKSMATSYVPSLKVITAVVPLNGLIAPDLLRSDHAPFWFRGIPAVMITDGSEFRNKNYHTVDDVVDSLNFNFMRQVTQAGLATMIELAGMRHAGLATWRVEEVITASNTLELTCGGSWYPNPSAGRLSIDLADCRNRDDRFIVTVTDVMGRVILKKPLEEREAIDLQTTSPGMYWVTLQGESGRSTQMVQIY